jgi:hypothetical protein
LGVTCASLGVQARQAPAGAPAATNSAESRPAIVLRSQTIAGTSVFFQTVPWGPQTFAVMESAADSFYNKRSWPFARLETREAFTLDGTRLAPGNYALVFHPASREQPAMSLEVRKVGAGEFLQAGNVMQRAPEGESAYRGAISFERVADTQATLAVTLHALPNGLRLEVRYGDRRLERLLTR